MIDHERFRLLAAAAVDGELSPDDGRDLDRHLATCPVCRAESAAMQRDHLTLGALPMQPVAPRVRAAVLKAATGRGQRSVWALVAAGALLLIAVAGGTILAGALPRPTEPVPTGPVPTGPASSVSVPTSAPASEPAGGLVFAEPVSISIGGTLRAIDTADLDRDGDLDLVVADLEGSGPVVVLLGDGTGRFGGAARYFAEHPHYIDVADLDLDGSPDVAVGNSGANRISVLFGDGIGGFGEPNGLLAGQQPREILALDADGDEWPDLVVANASSDEVSVILGQGDRAFAPTLNIDGGDGNGTIVAGDFNGDGHTDLASGGQDQVATFWGDGDGGFTRHRILRDFGSPGHLAAGDIDRDGDDDLAVRGFDRDIVTIGYSNPAGPFFETLELASPSVGLERTGAVDLQDLDGDGWLDLIVGSGETNDLLVYFGDGAGGFREALTLTVGAGPIDVAVGDFNGDGSSDLVTANIGDGTLSVLLQR